MLPPSTLFLRLLLFFVYTDVYTHPPRTLILSLVRSRSPRHITQKIGMKRTKKKERKEKKLSDSFFVFEQGLSSLFVHMVQCSPFQMLCWVEKKSSVSFSSRDIFSSFSFIVISGKGLWIVRGKWRVHGSFVSFSLSPSHTHCSPTLGVFLHPLPSAPISIYLVLKTSHCECFFPSQIRKRNESILTLTNDTIHTGLRCLLSSFTLESQLES